VSNSSIENPKSKIQNLALLAVLAICTFCRTTNADEPSVLVYSYFNAEAANAHITDDPLAEPMEEEPCEPCVGKRYVMDRHRRAGCAQNVACWAVSGTNCRYYAAGYVGGGALIHGDNRDWYHDGTWGLDYVGIVIPKRVFLNWWHGRHEQGGVGAYKTDGPKIEHK